MQQKALSVFMLAMINVAAICNIANLPFTAQYGFASLFYYALGALVFFIPVGLVSAELATGWPERGGVYIWVREALGEKLGFVAIWLQWVENIIWYPTIVSYVAATLAYIFDPALAQNKHYVFIAILVIFWAITFVNFLGMKVAGWISTLCVVIGIFIPGIFIITMGILWLLSGNPSNITFNLENLFPKISSFSQMTVLPVILLLFGGLEMSAVHAKDVDNPQKNYPRAIILSAAIIFGLLSMGALSIAIVVPKENIELASGTIEAIRFFLSTFHLDWALPILIFLMVVGALGMISTWLIGPPKGLLVTARHGELPPLLQKTNKKNMPIGILIMQAVIISFLALIYEYMPTVSSAYGLLFILTAQCYLIMYVLLFLSAIVLRYKKPNVYRHYKVPFGKVGIWIVSMVGLSASSFAIFLGFFPPVNFNNPKVFTISMIAGMIITIAIPLLINHFKKSSWHIHKKD